MLKDHISKRSKNFIIFSLVVSLIFYFCLYENLNFLNNKEPFFFDILPNTSVADSYKYLWEFKSNNYSFFDYLDIYLIRFIENHVQHGTARFYPSNDISHLMYFSIFNGNILLFSFFNFFIYIFIIFKLSKLISDKKIYLFYLFNLFNFLIIGALSLPNKEITAFFSFSFFIIYYFNRNFLYLFFSIIFSFFTRFEFIFILFLSIIIISPYLNKIFIFFKNKFKYNFIFALFFYLISGLLINLLNFIPENDFLNIILGGEHYQKYHDSFFLNYMNFFNYIFLVYLIYYFFKFFFKHDLKNQFGLILIFSLFVVLLNYILPNYYWFAGQIADIEAFQTNKSLGVTIFLYSAVMNGFYFIIFPFKIAFTLFSGSLQKPNLVSYETIFTYFSHISFFILAILAIIKKKFFLKNIDLLFVAVLFMVMFSLPPISVHRYIFFIYEFFVIACFVKDDYLNISNK